MVDYLIPACGAVAGGMVQIPQKSMSLAVLLLDRVAPNLVLVLLVLPSSTAASVPPGWLAACTDKSAPVPTPHDNALVISSRTGPTACHGVQPIRTLDLRSSARIAAGGPGSEWCVSLAAVTALATR